MKTRWQATSVAEMLMTQNLRWGLRLRMLGSWFYLALEVAAFLMLIVLGSIQAAMGQVEVAGVYVLLALVFMGASLWARRLSLRGASGSLLELIELAIRRARRSERMAWANYFMTVVTGTAVLVLYLFDFGDPAAAYQDGARVAAALGILAAYGIGVAFYHVHARRRIRRFVTLRSQFASEAGAG